MDKVAYPGGIPGGRDPGNPGGIPGGRPGIPGGNPGGGRAYAIGRAAMAGAPRLSQLTLRI